MSPWGPPRCLSRFVCPRFVLALCSLGYDLVPSQSPSLVVS